VDGESAEASVVGGADGCGVGEAGPGFHGDAARGGGLFPAASADLGLPTRPYGRADPFGDGAWRVFAFALAVALHRPLADPDLRRDGFGRLELLDQEVDARLECLGRLAGEALPVGAFDGVVDLSHSAYSPSSRTASPPLMCRAGL
jgi:hypothetical protein